jgi:hypothetical protein
MCLCPPATGDGDAHGSSGCEMHGHLGFEDGYSHGKLQMMMMVSMASWGKMFVGTICTAILHRQCKAYAQEEAAHLFFIFKHCRAPRSKGHVNLQDEAMRT